MRCVPYASACALRRTWTCGVESYKILLSQQRTARRSVRGVACWTTDGPRPEPDRPRSGPVDRAVAVAVARLRLSVRPWKNMSSVELVATDTDAGTDCNKRTAGRPGAYRHKQTTRGPDGDAPRSRRIGFLELTRHQQQPPVAVA